MASPATPVSDLQLPAFDYTDADLHGPRFHDTMRAQTGFPPHTMVRPLTERPRSVRDLLTQFRAIVEKRMMRKDVERSAHRNAHERRLQRAEGQRGDKRARYMKPGDERSSVRI